MGRQESLLPVRTSVSLVLVLVLQDSKNTASLFTLGVWRAHVTSMVAVAMFQRSLVLCSRLFAGAPCPPSLPLPPSRGSHSHQEQPRIALECSPGQWSSHLPLQPAMGPGTACHTSCIHDSWSVWELLMHLSMHSAPSHTFTLSTSPTSPYHTHTCTYYTPTTCAPITHLSYTLIAHILHLYMYTPTPTHTMWFVVS